MLDYLPFVNSNEISPNVICSYKISIKFMIFIQRYKNAVNMPCLCPRTSLNLQFFESCKYCNFILILFYVLMGMTPKTCSQKLQKVQEILSVCKNCLVKQPQTSLHTSGCFGCSVGDPFGDPSFADVAVDTGIGGVARPRKLAADAGPGKTGTVPGRGAGFFRFEGGSKRGGSTMGVGSFSKALYTRYIACRRKNKDKFELIYCAPYTFEIY